jgi:hypothetical protein
MDWTPLISGFVGAMIGSLTSIAILIIQNMSQNRRESQRLIFDTAWKDYELRFRYASEGTPQRAAFPVILAYHHKMMDLLERGELSPRAAREILDAQVQMGETLQRAVDEITKGEDSK